MALLEIIAFDIEGCQIAQKAGADRIELCADPHLGGTTPSFELIQQAKASCKIPIHVMVRPRGGNFCYNEAEVNQMESTIKYCKANKIDGVVFGALHSDGYLDIDINRRLINQCQGLSTTFHRAFDEIAHPFTALEQIINLGFDRILTSGIYNTANEGREVIKRMILQAEDRIIIMPGSGIKSDNLEDLNNYLGATDYHSSAKMVNDDGRYIGIDVSEVKRMKEIIITGIR